MVLYQFEQTPKSAVFRYRKSWGRWTSEFGSFRTLFPFRHAYANNGAILFRLSTIVIYFEQIQPLSNVLTSQIFQTFNIPHVVAYACQKGKEYENFRIRKFNDPRLPISEYCRIRGLPELIYIWVQSRSIYMYLSTEFISGYSLSVCRTTEVNAKHSSFLCDVNQLFFSIVKCDPMAPLHKTIVSLQLMVSLQTMVTIIDFLILIGYGAVLLW